MTRRNKVYFVLSILIILAPMAVGAILWDRLRAGLATSGGASFWGLFLSPLLFLLLHVLCVGSALHDYRKNGQSPKIVALSMWILPAITAFVFATSYTMVLGGYFFPVKFIYIFFGTLFILFGNYMPKARRSRTFGFKIRWTLANEENWNKTHRFGGKVAVICGIVMLLCVFLPASAGLAIAVLLALTLVLVLLPFLYSYLLYKKDIREGKATKEDYELKKSDKIARVIVLPVIVLILVFCAVISFTGNIAYTFGEDALVVDPSYWSEVEIRYSDIESAELTSNEDAMRLSGFGSSRLSLGLYQSEALGTHSRYAYVRTDLCVLLKVKGSTVVLSCESTDATRALYEDIVARMQ